jgi:hypothetical protein
MQTLTDNQLAELCGMTSNNLRMTYKKNSDPIKQRVYQFLRLGAEQWLELQKKQAKNKELIELLQTMKTKKLESFEDINDSVEYVNKLRKGREIASFD